MLVIFTQKPKKLVQFELAVAVNEAPHVKSINDMNFNSREHPSQLQNYNPKPFSGLPTYVVFNYTDYSELHKLFLKTA